MNFNLLKTAALLIIALIVLPYTAFYLDTQFPLSNAQWHTLSNLFILMFTLAISCFIIGEITKNCSQVDKLWSIVPAIYVWMVAFASDMNPRITLMAVMVTIWSIRLTFNFARRGGYSWKFWSGKEDYRWEVLRQTRPVVRRRASGCRSLCPERREWRRCVRRCGSRVSPCVSFLRLQAGIGRCGGNRRWSYVASCSKSRMALVRGVEPESEYTAQTVPEDF